MGDFFDPKKTQDISAQAEIAEIDKPSAPQVEPEVTIHTMPKRYLSSRPNAKKAKSTGFVILSGGVIMVLVAFALLYFYFVESPPEIIIEEEPITTGEKKEPTLPKEEPVVEETERQEPIETSETTTIPVLPIIPEDMTTSTPEETATTSVIIPPIEPPTITLAQDSDKDGLTDQEEILLSISAVTDDTDKDGYKDLEELLKLYNPDGEGKLIGNLYINEYTNKQYNYALLYPREWKVKDIGGKDSVIFELGENQFIQIVVQPNPRKLSIEEWYQEQFSVSSIKSHQLVNKEGWTGVKNEDGLTYYLIHSGSDQILTLSYSLGVNNVIYYKSTFNMMINSLRILGE
ncbi:hypothetical protein ACFLZ9_00020 [Patescibacteria group bacterium]